MSNTETRLRKRIRSTLSDLSEDLSGEDSKKLEDEVLALIRAYGAAGNGTRDAVFENAITQMRQVLNRRQAVMQGEHSSSAY